LPSWFSTEAERTRRCFAALVLVGMIVLTASGCGESRTPVVVASSPSTAPAAADATASSADTALTVAERFVAASQPDTSLVARGCVRPDQITGTSLVGVSTVCVFARAYGGEVRVGLASNDGVWHVVDVEVV
jgi:hypothetical protein